MADETNSDVSLENSPDQSNSFEYIQQDQSQSDSPNSDDDDHHQNEPHLLKQQTNGQDETQQNGLNGQENSSSSNDDEVEDDESNQEETRQNEVNGQDKSNSSNEEEEEEEEKNEVNSQHKSSSEDEDEEEQELKPQREIDNDEIPPAELPNVQKEIRHSPRSSPTQFNENNNNRPLTKLEDPFGTHQEQEEVKEEELSPIETTINETNNSSTNENLLTEKNPLEHPTLSSFLPDVINQTTEQNNIPTETNPSNENPTDSTEVDPKDFTEEDFPPLPKTELPIHQIINDQDFPPLNPPTETTTTTTDQQAELEPPLDILKNKSLLKQTLVKGETNTRPSRSTIVTISYSLSLIDSLTSNTRFIEQISNEKYFIGERDLIGAIDVALLSMDRGEKALVESDVRHCYGEQGCEEKQIPPVTTLNPYKMLIEIELHDWTQPIDIQLLSVEERIFWSDKKRLNGNFYYRRQDYKNSLECYQGASRYLDLELNPIDSSIDQNQINLLVEKYIQVQNNLAQTYLLVQKYEDCFNTAANVLKFDPKNVKALFRQGKALFELGKYQEAIQPLKLFLQIQRANPNVDSDKANQMIQISETKLANYQKSEKEIYQRMFRPTTANNQQQQQQQTKSKKTKQNVHSSDTNWLPYVALGAGALAVLGYIAFTKYHKLS